MAAGVHQSKTDYKPVSMAGPRLGHLDHGMLSEYGPRIMMQPRGPLPVSVEGRSVFDGEPFPILQKPTASTVPLSGHGGASRISEFSDPDLCVTPEKSLGKCQRKSKGYPTKSSRPVEMTDSEDEEEFISQASRSSQRVRFDNVVEVKQMSPDTPENSVETSDSQDNLHRTKPPVQALGALNSVTVSSGSPTAKSQCYRYNVSDSDENLPQEESDDEEIIDIVAQDKFGNPSSDSDSGQPRLWRPGRPESYKPGAESPNSRILLDPPSSLNPRERLNMEDLESKLERPEFNSVLRMQAEIEDMKISRVNTTEAVRRRLQSDKVKAGVEEKVTSHVNTACGFGALPSIDVLTEEVESVEKQKVTRVRPQKGKTTDLQTQQGAPPDLLELYRNNMQRETASYSMDGLPTYESGPETFNLSHTYDVYRHTHSWEGWG